ncbi:MAG: solute:sodium symporter family transporter [Eubacteriales bacterium]
MDSMVIISFLIFACTVGAITFFKTKNMEKSTSDGYFLGGRSFTGGVIASSLLLTNLSAVSFVGMSAQAYTHNMSVMGWEVGSGITLILIALFLIPRYLKQGITTIPQFIQSRFDNGTRQFVAILFLISYIVNMLPITLYSGAVAMSQIFDVSAFFGISYAQGIWVTVWTIGLIGICYAVFGGLRAVAISDTINGIALVIGGLLVPVFALLYLGDGNMGAGLELFFTSTPEKFNAIGSNTDPLPMSTMFTGLLLVNLYYWGTDQSIVQRGLAAKNLEEGQKGFIYAGLLKVLTPIILIIPGIMAYQILGPDVENPDIIYPELVKTVLPLPLVGFFASAMMGAILSTFNGVLNSASTLFAFDVYRPKWGKDTSEEDLVKVGKKFGLVVAFFSMFCAPFIMNAPTGLYDYLQTINGFFNVPIFTIIFMGYMTKRVPPIAAKIAITFFVTTYGLSQLVFKVDLHYLHVSAILFVISCLIMHVIGKMKPMDHDFVLENNHLVEITPWKNRFKAGSFVIFIMLSMYIIFSDLGLASATGFTSSTFLAIVAVAAISFCGAFAMEKASNKSETEESTKGE